MTNDYYNFGYNGLVFFTVELYIYQYDFTDTLITSMQNIQKNDRSELIWCDKFVL